MKQKNKQTNKQTNKQKNKHLRKIMETIKRYTYKSSGISATDSSKKLKWCFMIT